MLFQFLFPRSRITGIGRVLQRMNLLRWLPLALLWSPSLPGCSALRTVVLPGFGNAIEDYDGFTEVLARRGVQTAVVPIERRDWLNIAAGVLSPRFWACSCVPDDLFRFYYDKVDATVKAAAEDGPVTLLCHSAGGWLARGLVRDNDWRGTQTPASELVEGIVTLGSPHFPPESGECMTRGALAYVATRFPGAHLKELYYMSVAGTAVMSDPSKLTPYITGFPFTPRRR